MNIVTAIETMRTIVDAYDKFEAKKLKIKRKTEKVLKGGKNMKFGTVIGIVVGALALIAAGAAAVYFLTKRKAAAAMNAAIAAVMMIFLMNSRKKNSAAIAKKFRKKFPQKKFPKSDFLKQNRMTARICALSCGIWVLCDKKP